MAVNRRGDLFYNEAYVESLSDSLCRSVLAHEVVHVVLAHIARYHEGWNPSLANIAADLIDNDLLDTEGFELDDDWIKPVSHEWAFQGKNGPVVIDDIPSKSMEEIYAILEANVKMKPSPSSAPCSACGGSGKAPQGDNGDGDDDGSGKCPHCNGTGQDGGAQVDGIPGHSQDEHRCTQEEDERDDEEGRGGEVPEEWKFKMAEAAAFAKQRGKLSGRIGELVGDLLEAKVDWRTQLLKYISAMLPYDFTWSRPARKAASLGFYMPAVLKEYLEVVVHIDTSGSISTSTLREFLTEIKGILTGFESVKMTLITCDAAVQDVFDLTPDNVPELEDLEMRGRGGTSHTPVVDWICENKSDARVFISLTDGYSDIENCYENLPYGCDRLILLDGEDHCMEARMEPYGSVICLPREEQD